MGDYLGFPDAAGLVSDIDDAQRCLNSLETVPPLVLVQCQCISNSATNTTGGKKYFRAGIRLRSTASSVKVEIQV